VGSIGGSVRVCQENLPSSKKIGTPHDGSNVVFVKGRIPDDMSGHKISCRARGMRTPVDAHFYLIMLDLTLPDFTYLSMHMVIVESCGLLIERNKKRAAFTLFLEG
jgi:hypothetical protein